MPSSSARGRRCMRNALRASVLTACLTAPGTVPANAQAPAGGATAARPLAIEDYYRIRSVGSTEISPDGLWVAFTVSTPIEENNTSRVEVWLVPSDGSAEARRVSPEGESVGAPSWSADGKLRFSAGRVRHIIDPTGRVASTTVPAERPSGEVSPDGKWMASVRPMPAAKQEKSYGSDFEKRHEERFKGVQFDWLAFQRDGGPFPVPDPRDPSANPPAEVFVQAAGGADARAVTSLGFQPRDLSWSPDGGTLLFVADPTYRDETRYGQSDLFVAALDGRVTRLTDEYGIDNRSPRYSPDGKSIAFIRSWGTDRIIRDKLDNGGPTDLHVMPAGGGAPINLTADWPLQPGAPMWSPDGRSIHFVAGIGGGRHLFRVPAKGGTVQQVTKGERRITGLTIDRDFHRMAYTVGTLDGLPEVHVANIDGTGEKQLTRIHDAFLADVALSKGETVRYRSYDGTHIEGFLLYPAGYREGGGPYPLIVSSHGGPHSASGYDFDFKLQYFAAAGYFVLETNFRSSTGYGDDFLWATWGEWGTKDGQDVVAGIDYVIAHYPIDRARVGHTGHSYGGFMTNWLITQYPDRFAAAITGAGITNWVSDYGTADIARTKETEFYGYPWEERAREVMIRQSPLTYAGRVRTPTLFVHGEVDQRVPYEEAEQMYTALKKLGVPAKMIQYAGMPHGIRGHWNNVHRMINEMHWWEAYLKVKS